LTFLCKLHDPKKMNPPSFHNRIRKAGALVTATLILPALAFAVVSLSFSAQAGEKKKVTGTHRSHRVISQTVVPLGPGDDPKHKLVVLEISRDTTTSSDPDFNEAEHTVYEQHDEVAGTGTHRGYFTNLLKNGDTEYGLFEGTFETTFKEDGSWETTTWEGTWKDIGGTGKLKNIKGSGTYRGKATAAEGAITEFEGEVEY
jgi:hypothetical protein